MAVILNNPALPPSPGLTPTPYQDYFPAGTPAVPTGGGDPTGQVGLWLASAIQYPYEVYEVRTFLSWDEGLISLPVAGPPGTPAEIIRVSAGQGAKVVAWFGRRKGSKIQAPQQEANTATQQFSGERVLLDSAKLLADNVTWVYTWAGFYLYLLTRRVSPNVGDSVSFGQPPYAQGSATTNVFGPADLNTGITIPQT